jgi:hypothetical protein
MREEEAKAKAKKIREKMVKLRTKKRRVLNRLKLRVSNTGEKKVKMRS